MSARRVTALFIAGLVIIIVAVWLSSTRQLEPVTGAGDLVLPGLQKALNSVSEVRLFKGDKSRTTLRQGTSGWTVSERGYPADSGKVRKLLLDLASLQVVEEKTRTPANFPLLGVQDVSSPKSTGTQVDAIAPGKTYSLIVGKTSGAKSEFVRVANSDQSLLATPAVSVETDPKHWLDQTLLDVQQERIRNFTIRPAGSREYTGSRANKNQRDFTVADLPKGRELANPTSADPVAGSLGGLTLSDVQHAPAAAPDAKSLSHATFRTFDGLQIDLTGRKDGARTLVSVAASSSDKSTQAQAQAITARAQGWEYEIPSYKYDGIFQPLEDLLKKPEPAKKAQPKRTSAQH